MRRSIVFGASLISLSALFAPASAAVVTAFDYTGGFVTFVAPTTGDYMIAAYGAQGGGAYFYSGGALGAKASGDFYLTAGETLSIAVGGQGDLAGGINGTGGGGGGSFVFGPGDTVLVVAGGGGGAGYEDGGGGGGGGYSGGGGTAWDNPDAGGGGGSYVNPDALFSDLVAGFNSGNGEVTITSIPEPGTWALLLTGLAGLGLLRWRLRRS
jgi:hypothetical protein